MAEPPLPGLVVRADALAASGMGHLARCAVLMRAWKARGGAVRLVSDAPPAAVAGLPVDPAREVRTVPAVHPHPGDLRAVLEVLEEVRGRDGRAPWLALDGYHFDAAYERRVRDAGFSLLVVDDTAHRGRYEADVLLNQNLGAEALAYAPVPGQRRLLGTEYVLLRDEFAPYRGRVRPHPEQARRVLVTMGGADRPNATGMVLEALGRWDGPELEARVVVGGINPHLAALERQASALPLDVRLLRDTRDMAAQMAWAEVAVSAAGSTCWEMAFMGLPAVLVGTAGNQLAVARLLGERGAAAYLGPLGSATGEAITRALHALAGDRAGRERLAAAGRRLVDGGGAERVVDALAAFPARAHPATRTWEAQ